VPIFVLSSLFGTENVFLQCPLSVEPDLLLFPILC